MQTQAVTYVYSNDSQHLSGGFTYHTAGKIACNVANYERRSYRFGNDSGTRFKHLTLRACTCDSFSKLSENSNNKPYGSREQRSRAGLPACHDSVASCGCVAASGLHELPEVVGGPSHIDPALHAAESSAETCGSDGSGQASSRAGCGLRWTRQVRPASPVPPPGPPHG